jgi:NAD(P)-dependent dehydrogenase (short-subunit alcohol dehydrogenase family)
MARTVVVTGASSGIGLAAAEALARAGDDVVLVGRHPGRLRSAVERVRAAGGRTPRSYRADFAVLDEVRGLGARLRGELERVDVLANNAGQLAAWSRRTVDGLDVTMQVNHVAGFLLAHLLLDRLPPGGRIVTTGSLAEAWGWLDVDAPAAPQARYRSRWLAYGASKQANLLFTVEAARRWGPRGTLPVCFFPGLVRSRFAGSSPLFNLGLLVPVLSGSPARGADTLVWLAGAPAAELVPGGYYFARAPFVASPRGTDPDRARRLWRASLAAAGLPSEDAG